jgi:CDP-4-dehydro-6-deoxyglucose reductase
MFQISLKNGKSFPCDSNTTIFEAAKNRGIILEHSCLMARCRSCSTQINKGTTVDKLDDLVLSAEEKSNNWILSCNAIPTSDVLLEIEDLGGIQIFEKKIFPAKIHSITQMNENVIEVCLRLPPSSNFIYNSGQYVNIIKGQIKRSYSIANRYQKGSELIFFVKKYVSGLMSNYWFNEAKVNDLLRIEGPIGSFFLREIEVENIIFLATGTGVAPIKAILESVNDSASLYKNKYFWLFVGARYANELYWNPKELNSNLNLKYIPVLSRDEDGWNGERGYIQDIVVKHNIPLSDSQVYACGSNIMIEAAQKALIAKGLKRKHFFSDAFVETN